MTDGKGLEAVGVTPDELMLPEQLDLANGRFSAGSRSSARAFGHLTRESTRVVSKRVEEVISNLASNPSHSHRALARWKGTSILLKPF